MINDILLAKKYVRSLLSKQTSDSITRLAEEIQAIADVVMSQREINEFFKSPLIPRDTKLNIVKTLVKRGEFSPHTCILLETLINKKQFYLVPIVAQQVHIFSDIILNRVRVKLTTATEPSVHEIHDFSQRIGEFFGKNIFVERSIDPSILGGFILEGDGKLIDLSIKYQIQRILYKV